MVVVIPNIKAQHAEIGVRKFLDNCFNLKMRHIVRDAALIVEMG
jgi:hypothetical protein